MATPLHDGTRPAPVLDLPAGTFARRGVHHRRPPGQSGAHRLPRRHVAVVVRGIIAEIIGTRTQEPASSGSSD